MTTEQRFRDPATGLSCHLLLCCLLLWLASLPVLAADPAIPAAPVGEGLVRLDLRPHLALLEDKEGRLGLEQILARAGHGGFTALGDTSPNFGFTSSAWWVRLTLDNPGDTARRVIVRQDYPLIDHLDFWAPAPGGGWRQMSTGDRLPYAQRPLDYRTFLFPVELAARSETTLYLRFRTQGALNIGLFVHSPDDLLHLTTEEYLALGIYYGGFMVLLVCNLIMFLSVRDRAFLYYLLYVLSYGLYMSVHNGLSFQYLWPGNPWLANQSLLLLLALSLFGCLRFTREILRSSSLLPRADRIAFGMEVAMLLALALAPFLSYRTMIVPMAWMTAVICTHMLVMGIIALVRGSAPARYYIVAFSALLGGVLAYMLKTFGLLPHNAFTQNAFQIGSLIEMVLLSLAIGSRINEMKQAGYLDALTQLHNRRHFNDRMHAEFRKAVQRGRPLSLAVLDIDHFKRFNDTHGHAEGDQALKAVARILAASVRKPAIPCRYGGEEFVVIVPNASAVEMAVLAERIRRRVEEETASGFRLTVSIGHATLEGGGFTSPECFFKAADFALYAAKEAGRNRAVGHRDCLVQAEAERDNATDRRSEAEKSAADLMESP
ncbi:GGDEF domain-containing protein [Azotobacter chroococcum subsp. isscasi]|nr:GGDEF domain-containing protein [Azotobacter chroococcum subsp. isscasi]